MNILHLSTSDLAGGAAKAAYRLHAALRDAGHNSRMVVREKASDDPDVIAAQQRVILTLARLAASRGVPGLGWCKQHDFNPDLPPAVRLQAALDKVPEPIDILCLHWITSLLSSKLIARLARRFRCPIVWMLTDQEPYTGGCHYSYSCDGFAARCGRCPQLAPRYSWDRSRTVWKRKSRYLAPLPITFVSSCSWTSQHFRRSSLFGHHRLEDIGDPIDTRIFRPSDKLTARNLLNIPTDAAVIFFGAFSLMNARKGMEYLTQALRQLPRALSGAGLNVFLLYAGHGSPGFLDGLQYPSLSLGYLKDDRSLALAYKASDIFVCPSIYEAGAMMVPEAMLCGAPVVAFDTGNAPDLIRNLETGYRAAYMDSADLARGIAALLRAPNLAAIAQAAYRVAYQRHSPEWVAARHTTLYESLLAGHGDLNLAGPPEQTERRPHLVQ